MTGDPDRTEEAQLLEEAGLRLREITQAQDRATVAGLWATWEEFRDAHTPVRQADTLVEFSNVLYHYACDVLGFDAVHHPASDKTER